MSDEIHFLPWLRKGLAGLYPAEGGTAAGIEIGLTLSADRAGGSGSETRVLPSHPVPLMGPGAVVGLDPSEILRRDPPPDTTGVEPNYFAAVEFRAADLPWRFTPGAPDAEGRLAPWLALVVVERRPGVTLAAEPGARLPVLTVDDMARELPPIDDAWAWAHVQYEGVLGDDADTVLAAALTSRAPALRARLFCPRHLSPDIGYTACLVPTTEAGRQAGLGQPGATDLAPAWNDSGGARRLPVYASWSFRTGAAGDFEALVRRLTPREIAGNVGLGHLDIGTAGKGLPESGTPQRVWIGGALLSPAAHDRLAEAETEAGGFETDLRAGIAAQVNTAATSGDPVVAPPAYGRTYTGGRAVEGRAEKAGWYDAVNTGPAHRAAAGLGAEVARARQEALMDAAWDAAGDIGAANMQLNVAQMAREVGRVARTRQDTLSEAEKLALAGPALHATPGAGTARTAGAQLHGSAIPGGLVSGAARRIARPRTGLATKGGPADPRHRVLSAFLRNPLGPAGRYRDAQPPAGLDASVTPGPVVVAGSGPGDPGRVLLRRPDMTKRPRAPFKKAPGTAGLIDALDAAQAPDGYLSRALASRIPALAAADRPPAAMQVAPAFREPAFRALADLAPDRLVPGLGDIAPDTVSLLRQNPAFIRAFLVGLNHEIAREFLWREFPTPLDATWFRHFWTGAEPDIRPIAGWSDDTSLDTPLGGAGPDEDLVLVIRGALPQRYPDLRLYAAPAKWLPLATANGTVHFRDEDPEGEIVPPDFAGQLAADVFFFGFRLSAAAANGSAAHPAPPGYFFVFEERPGAPRFGLEAATGSGFGTAPAAWDTVSWDAVTPAGAEAPAAFLDLGATPWMSDGVPRPGNAPGDPPGSDLWAEDAAALARQTLQRPARILVHASAMLPGAGKGA